jgi:hypothetical protein
MNSAQHLQREQTQSRAINVHAKTGAGGGVDANLAPTQVLDPTQALEEVCLIQIMNTARLINRRSRATACLVRPIDVLHGAEYKSSKVACWSDILCSNLCSY